MSEESSNGAEADASPETLVYPYALDPILQVLCVSAHNDDEFEFPITLTVGGTLVSGRLVGRKRYMKTAKAFYPQLAEIIDVFESNVDYSDEAPEVYFIHLIGAQHLVGRIQVPANSLGLWRGRLSEVSGITFGTINSYSDSDES